MASVSKRSWTHKGETKTKWVVRYVDQEGKRRLQTFIHKKDADRTRLKIETEIEGQVHTPVSQSMTIAQVSKEYQKHLIERHADGAVGRGYIENVSAAFRCSIVPAIGQRKLATLVPGDLGRLMTCMREGRLSTATIRDRRATLITMERWAVRRGYIKRCILGEAVPDYQIAGRTSVSIPTKANIGAIFECLEHRPFKHSQRTARYIRLKIHLAAFCGLRYGEIVALTLGDINFDQAILHIRHNLTRFGEFKGPKTKAGIRDVPMPAPVAALLKDWISRDYVPNEGERVLTGPRGKTMDNQCWYKHWFKLLARAGLRTEEESGNRSAIRFHALRHFAGSWWLENGIPITLVSVLLGHSDSTVTLRVYAHALQTRDERSKAVESASDALRTLFLRNNSATTEVKALTVLH